MNNQQKPEFKRSKSCSATWVKIIAGVLVLLALGFGACWFIFDGFRNQDDPAVILEKVGKHLILPNETPEITTIEQAGELNAQPFFSGVKDGDKILIYPKAARIIIYRPSDNILVNVGPIVDDSASSSSENAPESE